MNLSILKRNPELARNIKLELSTQRLVVMPVILLLLTALVVSSTQINLFFHENVYDYLARYSSIAFMLITALWGAKSASDGMLDEYNGRTWDWQRMSTLSPWKMTIGKLFGSTIYNWYGGSICLIIFLVSSISSATIQSTNPATESIHNHRLFFSMLHIVNSVLVAVSMQGLAILASLMQMKKGDGRSKIKSTPIIIVPLVLLMFSWGGSFMFRWWGLTGSRDEYWYGINFGFILSFFTTLFYAGWIVAGLYRTMRTELQYTNGLKWWITFLISMAVFNCGFFIGHPGDETIILSLTKGFAFIFISFAIIAFLMAILEPKEIVNFRTVLKYYKEKNYPKLYTVIPLWSVTVLFVIASGIITSLLILNIPDNAHGETYYNFIRGNFLMEWFRGEKPMLFVLPFAIIFFMIRDIAIILFVNLLGRNKRADATAILYLVILYVIVPLIMHSTGLNFLFYPNDKAGLVAMVGAPFAEAAIAIYILTQRWKDLQRTLAS